MRIVFIGAVEFSAHALRELIAMKCEIVGVCTLKESTFNTDHVDLTPIANDAGIPLLHVQNLDNPETLGWIRERKPDVIFCFGWSQLIKAPLLDLPPMGVVGFHPSELPANRGRHPLIWALVLGLRETASTFFLMDEGADSGELLSQEKVPIHASDDATKLYERVTEVALAQLRQFVPRLATGETQTILQDHRLANVWRKRGFVDGLIDWRMAAESIHNLVRGLTRPYAGAHFYHENQCIKVWKTMIEADAPANLEPGKVLSVDCNGVVVKAGIGAIRLLDCEPILCIKTGEYL